MGTGIGGSVDAGRRAGVALKVRPGSLFAKSSTHVNNEDWGNNMNLIASKTKRPKPSAPIVEPIWVDVQSKSFRAYRDRKATKAF